MASEYSFTAELWEHDGMASWHFVSLPEEVSDEIEELYAHRANGFGAVKVNVTIGATRWTTSVFPDKARRTYVLPVKKPVRIAEGLEAGVQARVGIVAAA
ncbi:DUF1905 domain-containing protein [Nocardia sp. NPDC051832]|uniref:DUF1905 domain-containing protein n=1 Tax=Nocardia sp. NPDC051832 TaxID=3155673 RepID=UPI003425D69A